jgi:hypothetical protein
VQAIRLDIGGLVVDISRAPVGKPWIPHSEVVSVELDKLDESIQQVLRGRRPMPNTLGFDTDADDCDDRDDRDGSRAV